MNNKLHILCFWFLVSTAYSQTCTLKVPVTVDDKAALLKTVSSCFKVSSQGNTSNSIDYTLSTNDFCTVFSAMHKEELYNDAYLEKYERLLKSDPNNPLHLEALAKYYNFHEQYLLSKGYREKAFKNLNFSYFKKDKDSAHYYSFRGLMRYNLEDKDGLLDVDKALTINPNDSLGMTTYAMVLLSLGDFSKLKQVMTNALNAENNGKLLQYMMFSMSDALIQLMDNNQKIAADSTFKKTLVKQNYDQLVNFKAIDEYEKKFPTAEKIALVKPMIEILVLMSKLQLFEEKEENIIALDYPAYDIAKIKALGKWFNECLAKGKLNSYTVYKNLGYVHYMLGDYEKSTEFFKKAKQVFPVTVRGYFFNDECIYNALIFLAAQKKNTSEFKSALQAKIKAEPTGSKNYLDYLMMAEILFASDSLSEANDWAVQATRIKPTDSRTLMFLAHMAYLSGSPMVCSSYISDAIKNINEELVFKDLMLQIMSYQVIDNDPASVCNTYNEMKKQFVEETCEECDRIKDKYIEMK